MMDTSEDEKEERTMETELHDYVEGQTLQVLNKIHSKNKKNYYFAEDISNCDDGKELSVIFRKYLPDEHHLSTIYHQIINNIKENLPTTSFYNFEPYASFINGFWVKQNNITLRIYNSNSKADPMIQKISHLLRSSRHFKEVIPLTKYSAIKCYHLGTKTNVRIEMSQPVDLHNSEFVNQLKQADERINELMLFLKVWFANMGFHDEILLTKYCLMNLIVFYLQNTDPPVLPAFKIIQENAQQSKDGTNYLLNSGHINMNVNTTVHELIKGFFEFYSSLDFESVIISPYLGKTINKLDFHNKTFQYPEYDSQMRTLSASSNEPVEELETQKTLCIQDMFYLNRNIAIGIVVKPKITIPFKYFKLCICQAHKKCSEPGISLKNMYKSLLVNIFDELSDKLKKFSFTIVGRGYEVNSLSMFSKNHLNLRKLWTKAYIAAIPQIIKSIYKIDIELLPPTENCTFKNFDETEEVPLPFKWSIRSSVNLWSKRGRFRDSPTFMDEQLALTEKLYAERKDIPEFSAQFEASLSLTVAEDFGSLIIEATNNKSAELNYELRIFVRSLKNFLRAYNIRHRIHLLRSVMWKA